MYFIYNIYLSRTFDLMRKYKKKSYKKYKKRHYKRRISKRKSSRKFVKKVKRIINSEAELKYATDVETDGNLEDDDASEAIFIEN